MTSIDSADLLEAEYGDGIRHLALEHKTGYLLSNALSRRQTPLEVSRKVCTTWLAKHKPSGEFTYVKTPGHLELWYGDRIRSMEPEPASGDELAAKLVKELKVSAPVRVCEQYLRTSWSSAGRIMTAETLEATAGERLRLREYAQEFGDDESAQRLATVLAEGQPVLRVSALLLRQWYTKYHPDSGPLRYETAAALEEALGDEMRAAYQGLGRRPLQAALGKRRKAVLVSQKTCHSWVTQYGEAAAAVEDRI